MAKFCLTSEQKVQFLKAIKSRKIDPDTLAEYTSEGRREFFSQFGDGKQLNIGFEKALAKGDEAAIVKWADKVTEDEKKKSLIIDRIKKLPEKAFKDDKFLEDIAEDYLGVSVSDDEINTLISLSKQLEKTKGLNTARQLVDYIDENIDVTDPKTIEALDNIKKQIVDKEIEKTQKSIKNYEERKIKSDSVPERTELQKKIDQENEKIRTTHKEIKKLSEKLDLSDADKKRIEMMIDEMVDYRYNGAGIEYGMQKVAYEKAVKEMIDKGETILPRSLQETPGKLLNILGSSKAIKSTLDLSASLRQGIKAVFTHPRKWTKNFLKSFKVAGEALIGKDPIDAIQAEIYSRKNFSQGNYKYLDIGVNEDAFPSTIPEKIPVFENLYKASEQAYKGFLYGLRADIMDGFIDKSIKNGVEIDDDFLKSASKMVNSMTGRGSLGRLEFAGDIVNVPFFSLRKLKSDIDFLTAHQFQKNVHPAVRKEATMNLVKTVTGLAGVLYIADKLKPGSVETDPRSSDFGKIKIGDTRFDISGGLASIVTLASRVLTGKRKSSTTGLTTTLGEDYASGDVSDTIVDFFENKLSPTFSVGKQIINRKNFEGEPLTVGGILYDLYMPLPIANYFELKDNPNSAPILAALIADGLGVGTNTYAANKDKDWRTSTSKELEQLHEAVGDDTFDEMNKTYNDMVRAKVTEVIQSEAYNKADDKHKKLMLDHIKTNAQDAVYDEYAPNFKYKRAEPTKLSNEEEKLTQF